MLPYAAEAEMTLSAAEISVLAEAYNRALHSSHGQVPLQIKFNYAWGLVRSKSRADQEKGVALLKEIHDSDKERQRECLYYLALGHYRLGNNTQARRYNETLLASEPDNLQAQSLRRLLRERVEKESLIGLSVIAGTVAVLGVALATLFKKR